MSKTYRRKKSKTPEWVKYDYVCINGLWRYRHKIGNDLYKSIAIYHSDKNLDCIPWMFRNDLERKRRAKERSELDKINKKGYYNEYTFEPIKKNLKWLYW